jgi:tetratricopeptide (TPR) repeat protein
MGDRAGARALFEASVRAAASAGDEALRWSSSLRLGRILVEDGEVGEAEALMAEAIARLRPVARPRNLVWALSHYAGSLTLAGSADRALPLATEALEIARGADLEYAVAQATLELARISLDLGDDIGALGHAAGCAARFAEAGDRDAVAYALSTAAGALSRLGLTSDAAVLAAVVERIRKQLGLTGRTAEQESLQRLIEETLDPDELARLGSRADALDDAQAVALALATASSAAGAATRQPKAAAAATPRVERGASAPTRR